MAYTIKRTNGECQSCGKYGQRVDWSKPEPKPIYAILLTTNGHQGWEVRLCADCAEDIAHALWNAGNIKEEANDNGNQTA